MIFGVMSMHNICTCKNNFVAQWRLPKKKNFSEIGCKIRLNLPMRGGILFLKVIKLLTDLEMSRLSSIF